MVEKSVVEKLRILLPHWLEHNYGHRHEFAEWAQAAREEGEEEVAVRIEQALTAMEQTDAALAEALAKLGGPQAGGSHHHHD